MLSNHSALLEIAAFDLVIGILLFRHYRSAAHSRGGRLIPFSVGMVGALVNASGFFCNASIVEMIVIVGGLGLAVLLLSAKPEKEGPRNQTP